MTEPTRIIVCGSRYFNDYLLFSDWMGIYIENACYENVEIITGTDWKNKDKEPIGADQMAVKYAVVNGYSYNVFEADWNVYWYKAGPIRNGLMAKYAANFKDSTCVAFWDGKSTGTKDMISKCALFKIPVTVYYFGFILRDIKIFK